VEPGGLSGGDFCGGDFTGPGERSFAMVVNRRLRDSRTLSVTLQAPGQGMLLTVQPYNGLP
jgi:hypothetical protein